MAITQEPFDILHEWSDIRPEEITDWKDFWRDIFEIKNANFISLQYRKELFPEKYMDVKIQLFDKYIHYIRLDVTKEYIYPALTLFWDEATVTHLIGGGILNQAIGQVKYCDYGSPCGYMSLPVYPKGWDIYISTSRPSKSIPLDTMGLPPDLTSSLLALSTRPKSLFAFTGNRVQGTHLMRACMQSSQHSLTKDRITAVDGTRDHQFVGRVLEDLFKKEKSTWITLNSSPSGVLGRLKDYSSSINWEEESWVSGWAHCRQLAKPCSRCGVMGTNRYMFEGNGCPDCGGSGRMGLHTVVDLWGVQEGKRVLLFDARAQAKTLIHQGIVCPNNAVNILGNLESND